MRITISKKVFLLFFALTCITFVLGVSVYSGIVGLQSANDEIRILNNFQLQIKELESFKLKVILGHAPSDKNVFETEMTETQRLIDMIGVFRSLLSTEQQAKLKMLNTYTGYYREAYLELFNGHESDHKFLLKNAALSKTILKKIESLPSNIRPDLHNAFRDMLIFQMQAYHNRDASKISEMKKLQQEISQVTDDPDILQAIRRFVLNVEINYFNFLNIKDRENFLEDTANHFSIFTADTILAISHDIRKKQTRLSLLIIAVLLLSVIFTITIWYLSSRYFRRFLGNMNRSIEAIQAANFDYDIPKVSDDEIGDLTLFMKDLSKSLKESIQKIAESEEKYRELVEDISDWVWELDEIGVCVYCSPVVKKILGLEAADVLGKKFFDLTPEEAQNLMASFQKSFDRREAFQGLESTNRHKDGHLVVLETSGHPIFDPEGQFRGYRGINRDITDRKRAEEELEKHREHLEELVEKRTEELKEKTGKIEESRKALTHLLEDVNTSKEELQKVNMEYAAANKELKEFAYIVSHDLKAPLRAISQLTHWISEDYSHVFDDDGKMQMDLIIKRVKRMDGLIDGILRYSRVGRIREKEEHLDLNLLVNEVIDNIAPPDTVQIIFENKLPVVLRDSIRMEQVFQNFFGNAIKFMDKREGIIKVGCADEGAFWKFSVSDNGPGIDKRYHDKIFQIFQTLTPRDEHESTGIGLTLVKKIIKLYGGSVWVESETGRGATFFFTLPKKGEKYEKL
jgi:PAS domain S-box-containing protein